MSLKYEPSSEPHTDPLMQHESGKHRVLSLVARHGEVSRHGKVRFQAKREQICSRVARPASAPREQNNPSAPAVERIWQI